MMRKWLGVAAVLLQFSLFGHDVQPLNQQDCAMATVCEAPQQRVTEMKMQKTLSIIKPDAVAANHVGDIIQRFERAGLHVVAAKMVHLTRQQAEQFYAVHKERGFFNDLVSFMISGPVFVMTLEGENAILKNRELMGATDPRKAAPGTIRADFAKTIDENAVHGSDGPETAAFEIDFFFGNTGLCPRTR
jgi:nucleoside-diphosphate kinase